MPYTVEFDGGCAVLQPQAHLVSYLCVHNLLPCLCCALLCNAAPCHAVL